MIPDVTQWSKADIEALVEAFRYRTGIDLSSSSQTPAGAWAEYKARQHVWVGKPRKRVLYPQGASDGNPR